MENLIVPPHHQFFTIEKANSALVLVRPIVTELMTQHKRLAKLQFEIEALESKIAGSAEELADEEALVERLYEEMRLVLDRVSHNVEELHLVGCVFKDFQMGMVDFPTHFNGRDVYLCWQHGELNIAHWHELEEGFTGRNPITEYFSKHSSAVNIDTVIY